MQKIQNIHTIRIKYSSRENDFVGLFCQDRRISLRHGKKFEIFRQRFL